MSTPAAGVYRLPVLIRSIHDVDRSGQWLRAGWHDFRTAPRVSLCYGAAFVLVGLALTLGLALADLGLADPAAGRRLHHAGADPGGRPLRRQPPPGGGPAGLHRQLLRRLRPQHRPAGGDGRGAARLLSVWVRMALLLFALFFNQSPPPLDHFLENTLFSIDGAALLLFGTVVGAVFATVVFSISAVSVPLIYDRPVDVLTAISVSLLTVRENFRLMFGWAAMIAVISVVGIATAFIGLAVAVPVLAYATWHAYRDLIGEGPTYPDDAQVPPAPRVAPTASGA